MRQVYCKSGHRHYEDEICPDCSGELAEVSRKTKETPGNTEVFETEGAFDPLIQEARDFWTLRIGRESAEELCPECDPIPGEV